MELEEVAQAATAYGDVTGVLAAESVAGQRSYLVSLDDPDRREDTRQWLILDSELKPVDERTRVRDVASLVAMAELAAELADLADEPRLASPVYLDEVGSSELAASMGIVEAFVAEVEARYKLPLR
jgi:hypothetical protein